MGRFLIWRFLRNLNRFETNRAAQGVYCALIQLFPFSYDQPARQEDRPVAHALQPTDTNTLGFPQTTHFPVAPFQQGHVEPAIYTATAGRRDIGELGHAIFQENALKQALDHRIVHFPEDPYRVFPINLVGRVHQAIRQLAVCGEEHQSRGIDIQPSDGNPPVLLETWQTIKHRRPPLRILSSGNLTLRLVIDQYPAHHFRRTGHFQSLAVEFEAILNSRFLPGRHRLPVDQQAAGFHPAFNFPARTDARAGKQFLNTLWPTLARVVLGWSGWFVGAFCRHEINP